MSAVVIDNGEISISLRSFTLLIALFFMSALFIELYLSCTVLGDYHCEYLATFPYISILIDTNKVYDRMFIFTSTLLMFGIIQENTRAYYSLLYGVIDAKINKALLYGGLLNTISMPLIGVFDWK